SQTVNGPKIQQTSPDASAASGDDEVRPDGSMDCLDMVDRLLLGTRTRVHCDSTTGIEPLSAAKRITYELRSVHHIDRSASPASPGWRDEVAADEDRILAKTRIAWDMRAACAHQSERAYSDCPNQVANPSLPRSASSLGRST